MLRKSHSSEWAGNQVGINNESGHSVALQQHFTEIRKQVSDFSQAFATWVASRRQALTTDKESYFKTLAEEQELIEGLKKQLASLVSRRQSIVAELQAEQKEYEECLTYNRELELQRTQLMKKLNEIKESLTKYRDQFITAEADLAEHVEVCRRKTLKDSLDLTLSQEKLGLYVESVEENVTKFTFKYIHPMDWERRYAFTIDVSSNRYRIRSCEPMIPHITLFLDQLNSDNDFYGFLRKLRDAFVDMASQQK